MHHLDGNVATEIGLLTGKKIVVDKTRNSSPKRRHLITPLHGPIFRLLKYFDSKYDRGSPVQETRDCWQRRRPILHDQEYATKENLKAGKHG